MTPEEILRARARKAQWETQYPLPPRVVPKPRKISLSPVEAVILTLASWLFGLVSGVWWGTIRW